MTLKHATAAALLAAAATATATTAVAKAPAPVVKSAKNAAVGKTVVVDARRGRTLYYLTGDTKSHLLCTATCAGFWPPVTVKSARTKLRAGKGVHGRLGVFKRPDGTFQVTLRGLPLYRFSGDSARGQANGEGIVSFGGTWHVMAAKASSASAPAPAASSPY